MSSTPRVWLVTGASSGFGRAVTETVLYNGEVAVAAVRSPSALQDLASRFDADRLLVLACDVTRRDDISSAFKKVYERFGRCDIVFNNAGVIHLAEVEDEDQDAMARKLFEVNFWGAANVSREAVRSFRELNPPGNGGHLLVHSSMVGHFALAGLGFYCARQQACTYLSEAPTALEGLTEALVKEINPEWHIKVSIIEPCFFKTPLTSAGMPMLKPLLAYEGPKFAAQKLRQLVRSQAIQFGDISKAAERIYSLSKEENPPLRYLVGKPAISEVREKYEQVLGALQWSEGWSEGLELVE